MTYQAWLDLATNKLTQAKIDSAHLDALILLEDVSGKERHWILTYPETELTIQKIRRLNNLLKIRASHKPLAYIRGHSEFYGRSFKVDPSVLVPRPETETIIDLLKELPILQPNDLNNSSPIKVLDVGTGSGAIAVTVALEFPFLEVEACDIDHACLNIAKTNVDLFTLNIRTFYSDILSNVSCYYDILLCNLPYVPDDYYINKATEHEPQRAIYGGKDGLDLYRRLFSQIKTLKVKPLYILLESLLHQHATLETIAHNSGYNLNQTTGYIQLFKRV